MVAGYVVYTHYYGDDELFVIATNLQQVFEQHVRKPVLLEISIAGEILSPFVFDASLSASNDKRGDESEPVPCCLYPIVFRSQGPNVCTDRSKLLSGRRFYVVFRFPVRGAMSFFRSYMDDYAAKFDELLNHVDDQKASNDHEQPDSSSLHLVWSVPDGFLAHASRWYESTVVWLSRAVALLGSDDCTSALASLLHLATTRTSLSVWCENTQLKSDIERLFSTISLQHVLEQFRDDLSQTRLDVRAVTLTVDSATGRCSFEPPASNDFRMSCAYCKRWAGRAFDNVENPLVVRDILENFRVRFTQDMNSLQRLLDSALHDMYALYRSSETAMSHLRCCSFLRQTGNSEVLLTNMTDRYRDSSSESGLKLFQILGVISQFLGETGQAPE